MRQRFLPDRTSTPRSPWYSIVLGLLAGSLAFLLAFELADILSGVDWS